MRYFILLNLILYLISENIESTVPVRKFVYQKDISEHCRRKMIPSVFLGEHVMEANSQILHFSHLEVPYSCFISIRAESGNNIVLVFQVGLDSGERTCEVHSGTESPVSVYEMGETFGGYWGPIPSEFAATGNTIAEKYYTQRTKPDTTTAAYEEPTIFQDEDEDAVGSKSESTTSATMVNESKGKNYISYEVPLLKVSGKLVRGDHMNKANYDIPENDEKYDFPEIVLKRGESYDSKIIPLLQYSLMRQRGSRVGEDNGTESKPRYQLDFNLQGATLDPRLSNLYDSGRITKQLKFHRKLNRLLNFKKRNGLLFVARSTPYVRQKSKYNNDTWSYIEALLKNVSNEDITQSDKKNSSQSKKYAALLHNIADWQQNYSIYLAPNLSRHSSDFNKVLKLNIGTSTVGSVLLTNNSMQTRDNLVSYTIKSTTKQLQAEYKESAVSSLNLVNESLSTIPNNKSSFVTNLEITMTPSENISEKTIIYFPTISDNNTSMDTNDSVSFYTTDKSMLRISGTTSKTKDITSVTIQSIANFVSTVKDKIFETTETVTTLGSKLHKYDNNESVANWSTESVTKHPTIVSSIMPIKLSMGSIVDRESWENVVQVAPKMAGLLTDQKLVSMPVAKPRKNSMTRVQNKNKNLSVKVKSKRRKRSIQVIPIDSARPYNQTTDPDVVTTSEAVYSFSDLYDFAKLFELQDDNLYGHIVLRHMQHHVGKKIFDLCEKIRETENKTRYVYLFKTSRIVLALNQFTWKSLTIIATPVRTLMGSSQCDRLSLECQVSGARVCVDALNACDGVPNCGTYDIYDEDRLKCSGAQGLQHNVILAAFTFLAVLLTMIYIVYYWLKQCVPKVSEAFFIYTDGTENLLHLNSIMKSPLLLTEDSTKFLVYQSHLFEADLDVLSPGKNHTSIFKRIFRFFTRRKTKYDAFRLSTEFSENPLGRRFSFPEMEINRMRNPQSVEVSVQTGESLEMTYINKLGMYRNSDLVKETSLEDFMRNRKPRSSFVIEPHAEVSSIEHIEKELEPEHRISVDNELNMLKFFRDARLSAMQWNESETNYSSIHSKSSMHQQTQENQFLPAVDERELNTTMYDRSTLYSDVEFSEYTKDVLVPALGTELLASISEENINEAIPGPSGLAGKRLRFDENFTKISSTEVNDDPVQNTNSSEADTEPSTVSTGRDFIRFWSKKGHKKKLQNNK